FSQAEDGIRDKLVTGVQTCALPIWHLVLPGAAVKHQMPASRTTFRYAARHAFDSARSRVIDRAGQPGAPAYFAGRLAGNLAKTRSEERRVGKESSSRWLPLLCQESW